MNLDLLFIFFWLNSTEHDTSNARLIAILKGLNIIVRGLGETDHIKISRSRVNREENPFSRLGRLRNFFMVTWRGWWMGLHRPCQQWVWSPRHGMIDRSTPVGGFDLQIPNWVRTWTSQLWDNPALFPDKGVDWFDCICWSPAHTE